MVTTSLYEKARDIVLDHAGFDNKKHTVIFCSPRGAQLLTAKINSKDYRVFSSADLGLAVGVRAIAVKRNALPPGDPFLAGGGNTKLISTEWIIWADPPDKFEAGTPAVMNILTFVRALCPPQKTEHDFSSKSSGTTMTAREIMHGDGLDNLSGRELLDKLRQTIIGHSIEVPTAHGKAPFINFDSSASTPAFKSAWDCFRLAIHQPEEVQRDMISEVRAICSKALNAPPADFDIHFTSNTTESINLVAKNLDREAVEDAKTVVLGSYLEHSSNELPWRIFPGLELIRLGVDKEGFIDTGELEKTLRSYNMNGEHGTAKIRMVALSGASNVLGSCNDLKVVSSLAHRYGAKLLVDAAQLIPHRGVDVEGLNIDYLAFSAHKMYAPFGCGVLVARKGLLNFGDAEMESIRASGEENAAGIAAFGKAFSLLRRVGMDVIREEERKLTASLLQRLSILPGIRVYGIKDPSSAKFSEKLGVVAFDVKSKSSKSVARHLALESGIGVRWGCHCAHILIKHMLGLGPFVEGLQRVIQIIFPRFRFLGVVRVSLGIENSEQEIITLENALKKIIHSSKGSSSGEKRAVAPKTRADVEKQWENSIRETLAKVFS